MTKLFLLTLAVCLTAVVPASAQSSRQLKVTLPAFTVGNIDLPAGEYSITDIKDIGNSSIFLIRAFESGKSVDIMGNRADTPNDAEKTNVVLSRNGNKYGVKRIDFEGYTYTF